MEDSSQEHRMLKPPAGLHPEIALWWKEMVQKFAMEPHHLEILRIAAEALDEYRAAKAIIAQKGLTYATLRGMYRQRPEVGIMHLARLAFIRAMRELNLPGQDNEGEAEQDTFAFDNSEE